MNKNKKKNIIFSENFIKIATIIHLLFSIIGIYISLHCNSFFSIETLYAFFVPYIYLPFRYYFKKYCKNMPDKICLLT